MPSRLAWCGRDQPVREQVQAQVGVVRVRRRVGERADHGQHDDGAHAAALVAPRRGRELVRALVLPEPARLRAGRLGPELRLGVPRVEHALVGLGDRREAVAPRALRQCARSSPRASLLRTDPRLVEVEVALDLAHQVVADLARRCAGRSARRARRAISSRRIAPYSFSSRRPSSGSSPPPSTATQSAKRAAVELAQPAQRLAARALLLELLEPVERRLGRLQPRGRLVGRPRARRPRRSSLRSSGASVSPWPSSVTRITPNVSSRISGRSSTSSGTESAAASEIAPRMPAQPTATRSRHVSPKPACGTQREGHPHRDDREADDDAPARRAARRRARSASCGACRPSRMNSSASSPSDHHAPEGDAREPRAGVERGVRVPAGVDAGDDRAEHAGDVQLLGDDVAGVRGEDGEQDAQRLVRSGGG